MTYPYRRSKTAEQIQFNERRIKKLRRIVALHGGYRKHAEMVGLGTSDIANMLSGIRPVSDKALGSL